MKCEHATYGNIRKLDLQQLQFFPQTNVYAIVCSTGDGRYADFSVCAQGEDVDNLRCWLWIENDYGHVHVHGDKEREQYLGTRLSMKAWVRHVGYMYARIHCKIFPIECKLCARLTEQKQSSNDDQLMDEMNKMQLLQEENVSLKNEVERLRSEMLVMKHNFQTGIQNRILNANSSEEIDQLWKLQNAKKHTDFAFIIDGTKIEVHKCVLTTKSNFFADQFHSDTTGTEHVVEGTTTDAINAMVEFVYLGTANKLREHVTELYKLAVRFSISTLKEKSLELLEQPTSMETAAEYFIFALENKDRALICIAINYAERNGGKTRFFLTNVFLALIDKNLELYKTAMETLRNYI